MKKIALITTLFFTGCAPYVPLILLPSHPASSEGESAPVYLSSTTLDKQKNDAPNKQTKHTSARPGHDMNSIDGMDMEGMNHASK